MTTSAPPAPTALETPVLTCTACGGDNALDSRFCRHCGTTLRAGDPNPASATPASGAALNATASGASRGVAPAESVANAPAPLRDNGVTPPLSNATVVTAPSLEKSGVQSAGEIPHPHSAAEDVDKGRAQHFVERAERLSERGELPAAILACRQAIALSPQMVSGHATLGALLERTGDVKGAVAAYEHVVELWPDSPLERERLRALRQHAAQAPSAGGFHFNADELFPAAPLTVAAAEPSAVASSNPAKSENGDPASRESALQSAPPQDGSVLQESGVPVAGALTPFDSVTSAADGPVTTSDNASAATATGAPHLAPARVALPSSAALAAVPSISALAQNASDAVGNGASVYSMNAANLDSSLVGAPAFAPLVFEPEKAAKKRWDSSYFWRGAPLTATVGTGLLFLLWAANWSAARRGEVVVPPVADSSTLIMDDANLPDGGVTSGGPARLEAGVPGGGPNVVQPGDPATAATFSSAPAPPAPAGSGNAGTGANTGTSNNAGVGSSPSPSGSRTGGNVGVSSGGTLTRVPARPGTPSFPSVRTGGAVPPLPVSRGSVITPSLNGGQNAQDNTPRMPPPQIPSAGAPPITLGNSGNTDTDTSSTGGTPLNPVYGGGRGYIRLHTGSNPGSIAPSRPNNQASGAERDATNAARAGQGGRAVEDVSRAISRTGTGDPNLASRYQTRALLFLEQGDNARAIDDFNTAIQAYQDQIARDTQDQDAREGIEACRRGLRLAQRRLRR